MLRTKMLSYLLLACWVGVSFAKESVFENTHEYLLDNGLKLIVQPSHRAPVAVFQIWYKVGSRDEAGGYTGISHLLEHLMFKGTTQYPGDSFSKTIAGLGGNQNAATSSDYTMYYQELEASRLETSFELEADRMKNLTLTANDVLLEREVVKEERRLRIADNPNAVLYERYLASGYLSSGYHHPVIGWMEDIAQITKAQLIDWYQQWYAPNNAFIVVAGDVEPDAVYDLAQKYFGPIKPSQLPERHRKPEQASLGQKRVMVNLPAQLPQLLIGYLSPVLSRAQPVQTQAQTQLQDYQQGKLQALDQVQHQDQAYDQQNVGDKSQVKDQVLDQDQEWEPYALYVLSSVIGGGQTSRFAKSLVRGQQLAVQADAYYDAVSRDKRLLTLSAIPSEGISTEVLEQAIYREIESLKQAPISAKELEYVKTQVIAQTVYAQDSLASQASSLGQLAVIDLPWQLDKQFVNKIQAVTTEQVQAVARKYLQLDASTVATLLPNKSS